MQSFRILQVLAAAAVLEGAGVVDQMQRFGRCLQRLKTLQAPVIQRSEVPAGPDIAVVHCKRLRPQFDGYIDKHDEKSSYSVAILYSVIRANAVISCVAQPQGVQRTKKRSEASLGARYRGRPFGGFVPGTLGRYLMLALKLASRRFASALILHHVEHS